MIRLNNIQEAIQFHEDNEAKLFEYIKNNSDVDKDNLYTADNQEKIKESLKHYFTDENITASCNSCFDIIAQRILFTIGGE